LDSPSLELVEQSCAIDEAVSSGEAKQDARRRKKKSTGRKGSWRDGRKWVEVSG
jgi:hypothetical protein